MTVEQQEGRATFAAADADDRLSHVNRCRFKPIEHLAPALSYRGDYRTRSIDPSSITQSSAERQNTCFVPAEMFRIRSKEFA